MWVYDAASCACTPTHHTTPLYGNYLSPTRPHGGQNLKNRIRAAGGAGTRGRASLAQKPLSIATTAKKPQKTHTQVELARAAALVQAAEDKARGELHDVASSTAGQRAGIGADANTTRVNDADSFAGEHENLRKEVCGAGGDCTACNGVPLVLLYCLYCCTVLGPYRVMRT